MSFLGSVGHSISSGFKSTTHAVSSVNQAVLHNPVTHELKTVHGVTSGVVKSYVRNVGQQLRHPTFEGSLELGARTVSDFYTGGLAEIGWTARDLKLTRDKSLQAKNSYRTIARSALQAGDVVQGRIQNLMRPTVYTGSSPTPTSPINDALSQGGISSGALFAPLVTGGGSSPSTTSPTDQEKQAPADRGVTPAPTSSGVGVVALLGLALAAFNAFKG